MNETGEPHEYLIFRNVFNPMALGVVLGWAVCFVGLVVCTCVDKCDEANIKTLGNTYIPNINRLHSDASSATGDEYEDAIEVVARFEETYNGHGYASMEEYLHSRHNSTSSD